MLVCKTTDSAEKRMRLAQAAARALLSGAAGENALARKQPQTAGFTLVELIVVMALLATVLAVAAPSLSRFFRSRGLDSEARRFLALTRYAQSRAVSEGMPMVLWIDTERRTYGLMAESTYTEQDNRAVEFALDEALQIEVWPQGPSQRLNTRLTALSRSSDRLQTIRFTPDGFINETSPEWILIRQGSEDAVLISQSRTRLNYEIQSDNQLALRR